MNTTAAGRHTTAARSALLACALLPASFPASAADYVAIPAGSFASVLSDNSRDNAPVQVASFSMRVMPVTTKEFLAFAGNHPEWQKGKAPAIFADASYLHQTGDKAAVLANADKPITSVSWFAAQAYCESEGGRLPTWYEWEYVAAADETHADARHDPAWREKILSWYSQASTMAQQPVGESANYYGVRDMHGVIWEWVDDFNALMISADSRNQGDPEKLQFCGAGAISLQDRENYAVLMRIALLSSLSGADTTNNLGFRCVRNLPLENGK
jgi:formylglycine-generating enzyme required for sulfatase activity